MGPLEEPRNESRDLNQSLDSADSIKIRKTLSTSESFRTRDLDIDHSSKHSSKYKQKNENIPADECEGDIMNTSESQIDIHMSSPVDVHRNENMSYYSSFNSISDIDIENCPSSTPIDISARSAYSSDNRSANESGSTDKLTSFNETEDGTNPNGSTTNGNKSAFDPNILLDRLRLLTAKVKLHVGEMHHITKLLRKNNIIE